MSFIFIPPFGWRARSLQQDPWSGQRVKMNLPGPAWSWRPWRYRLSPPDFVNLLHKYLMYVKINSCIPPRQGCCRVSISATYLACRHPSLRRTCAHVMGCAVRWVCSSILPVSRISAQLTNCFYKLIYVPCCVSGADRPVVQGCSRGDVAGSCPLPAAGIPVLLRIFFKEDRFSPS